MFKKIGSLVLFVGFLFCVFGIINDVKAQATEELHCCITQTVEETGPGTFKTITNCHVLGSGSCPGTAPIGLENFLCSTNERCASAVGAYKPPPAKVESNCNNLEEKDCGSNNNCFIYNSKCYYKSDINICRQLPQNLCGPNNVSGSSACIWTEGQGCLSPVQANIVKQYSKPTGYQGALPDCAFSGTCRDVNDLLVLVIRFASGFFGILGTFALGYFIYGGFTMILSFGNAEKVKKGRDILVAAVVGLLICFFAYAVIKFMLVDVLNVAGDFNVIK